MKDVADSQGSSTTLDRNVQANSCCPKCFQSCLQDHPSWNDQCFLWICLPEIVQGIAFWSTFQNRQMFSQFLQWTLFYWPDFLTLAHPSQVVVPICFWPACSRHRDLEKMWKAKIYSFSEMFEFLRKHVLESILQNCPVMVASVFWRKGCWSKLLVRNMHCRKSNEDLLTLKRRSFVTKPQPSWSFPTEQCWQDHSSKTAGTLQAHPHQLSSLCSNCLRFHFSSQSARQKSPTGWTNHNWSWRHLTFLFWVSNLEWSHLQLDCFRSFCCLRRHSRQNCRHFCCSSETCWIGVDKSINPAELRFW